MHIPLDNVLLTGLHIDALIISSQKYASSLTSSYRFHNKSLCLFLGKLLFEITGV